MNTHRANRAAERSAHIGISLIEIMIGMAIAMVAAVIILQTFSNNQVFARATQGASDAQQTGNVLSRYLSRTLEESGSALSATEGIWGCQLNATIAGTIVHPRGASFPSPFQYIPVPIRLAPAIAISGSASGGNANIDTMVVSIGRPAASSQDYGATFNTQLNMSPNPAIGFNPNDFLLTYPPLDGAANVNNCNLVRVASTFAPTALRPVIPGLGSRAIGLAPNSVPLATNFGQPPNTGVPFFVRNIGQAPSLIALTVDASTASLVSLDLLAVNPTPQIIAENVVALKVLYGFDADNNNVISNTEWQEPTAALSPTTILNGTQASASLLSQIIAIRINYVVRSSQMAGYDGGNQTVNLFPDRTPSFPPLVLTGDAARYQYQVFDVTVPLYNPRAL